MRAMLAPLDTDVAIETPEHIVFHHRVAGPARRLLAYALDLLLCYGALFVLLLVIVLASAGAGGVTGAFDSALGAGIGLWLVMLFATQWVYFAVLEAWRGTTPGRLAWPKPKGTCRCHPSVGSIPRSSFGPASIQEWPIGC